MKQVKDVKELKLIANKIRQDIIKSLVEAGSGHSAGPLGMADVLTALYFNVLKHDPENPGWSRRDYFVLSNGHICPVLYATLANAGYFSEEELLTLRKLGTRLQGHPHRLVLPGLETSSGPLASGLSQAAGIAYGLKIDGKSNRVFCLTSDGEHDEAIFIVAAVRVPTVYVVVVDKPGLLTQDLRVWMSLFPLCRGYRVYRDHAQSYSG